MTAAASADASPTPSPPRPKRTYGRSRAAAPNDHDLEDSTNARPVSMIFSGPSAEASPSKTLLNRFSKTSLDWRQSLAALDADNEDQETEDDVQAARARMRKELNPPPSQGRTSSARPLAPTTSLSSLTELPSSPPLKTASSPNPIPSAPSRRVDAGTSSLTPAPPTSSPPTVHKRSPSPQSNPTPPAHPPLEAESEPPSTVKVGAPSRSRRAVDSDDDESSQELNPLASLESPSKPPALDEAPRSPSSQLHLFSDDEDVALEHRVGSRTKIKPLTKADQEQLRRDVSKAKRERQVYVSRTQTERRPVSEWLQRADGAVRTQPLPPVSTPEDIHQFPPSSLPVERSSDGAPTRIVNSKPTSSPTPLSRRTVRASSASSDSDDQPVDLGRELDKAAERTSRKKHWDGIKRKAMEAKALRPAVPNDSDDELSIVPTTALKIGTDPTKRQTARSLINGRIAAAAPNKQQQNLLRISGARVGGRRAVTETHLQFAGKDFDHANQKMANGGSRPAGQKPGRDNVISQLQMDAQMRASHQQQVRDLAIAKERQFGKGRQLPAKQAVDLTTMVTTSNDGDEHGSDSDEGDSDYDPVSGSDGEMIDNDDEASNASVVGDSVPLDTSTNGTPETDVNPGPSRQVAFVDLEDDDADSAALLHRPSRRVRRIAAGSDSEDDGDEPAAPAPITDIGAVDRNDTAAFGDFGDDFGAGGFSQLFETTQAVVGSGNDGLAGLRNGSEGLVPEHAALPAVLLSESQARRDNALVAGEMEGTVSQAVDQQPGNQYLNSQGFFTQSRPARQDGTQPPADSTTEVDPSSTLILSTSGAGQSSPTSNQEAGLSPTQGSHQLKRLRRRHSNADEEATESLPLPTVRRDAFQALADGARRSHAHEATKTKRRDAAFVDEQAEESDEDNAWGFTKGDDDEDDGMDEGYIPDLLDDAMMDEEEREKQKELADAKLREIAQEDDARREAEAKKITDGHYRHKRRGNDFLSDEEDEETRSRRLTKKQRRQRKLEREDGLYKLAGENNAFLKEYERDLESDNEFEESLELPAALHSPSRDALSSREVHELLRLNRAEQAEVQTSDEESESRVMIARRTRVTATAQKDIDMDTLVSARARMGKQTLRSTESYMMFLNDQNSNTGRGGSGRGGVSVVQKSNASSGHGSKLDRSRTTSALDVGPRTGRVLIDKTSGFN